MSEETETGRQQPATYQIRVQGELGQRWLHWFDGLAVTADRGDDGSTSTTLTGLVPDQAGLRGILNKLWDLNLTLLTVTLSPSPASPSPASPSPASPSPASPSPAPMPPNDEG